MSRDIREAIKELGRTASLTDEYYTVPEVAAYFKVAESTVYRWLKDQQLGSTKLAGGPRRISRGDIEDFAMKEYRKAVG